METYRGSGRLVTGPRFALFSCVAPDTSGPAKHTVIARSEMQIRRCMVMPVYSIFIIAREVLVPRPDFGHHAKK